MFEETPEFSAVTTLDGQQIDYYDSEIKKLIPKQDWMKDYASKDLWKADTEIRENVQQIYKNNIPRLMQRFNQTHGVHTYQRMYGCDWDDETGVSRGFDEYSYDGERFISLDLKENRYTASVPQAIPTVMKWNKDREQLVYLKRYYRYECVYWLKELLHFSKASSEKTVKVPESTGRSLTKPAVNDNKSDGQPP
ncbi:class I histocompatibility antigen, F10 alpha chain-like [Carassius auratus]|uniref:Class I histocompatibility antigen, F10 alpha chain-like n=1 Tax=Carassius auratus TaxID=7957 RepID=A0A6P6M4N3_CARAU|nr:class I histocompatibility antigen, F10 alpha chain-like [Carassius auratus]